MQHIDITVQYFSRSNKNYKISTSYIVRQNGFAPDGNLLTAQALGQDIVGDTCSGTGTWNLTRCKSVAVAILRGGPHTIGSPNQPHNLKLSEIKTLSLATGDGKVAAEVFDADLLNPQIQRVENWLEELSEGCSEPIPAVIVGHSLGGDAAIKVNYANVCSRILFDPFDPDIKKFVQGRVPNRVPPSNGAVYSFLAPIPNVFQGRPLGMATNVQQQCVQGADHNSIIFDVLGTTSFQNNIVGRELTRCSKSTESPLLGLNNRCFPPFVPSSWYMLLLKPTHK